MPSLAFPGMMRTKQLAGRADELNLLRDAIESTEGSCYVFFIGDGGVGKTRLLEEIPALVRDCRLGRQCRYSELVDFYHTEFHSGSRIERRLLSELDPQGAHFRTYREKRAEYEELRANGSDPQRQGELREELRSSFITDFNRFTESTRCVLCFDTVELVLYERDAVQQVCPAAFNAGPATQLFEEAAGWLVEVLPRLHNTAVLLAGRAEAARLRDRLHESLGDRLIDRKLAPFAAEEVGEYLDHLYRTLQSSGADRDQLLALQDLCRPAHLDLLHESSHGEPLLLAMVVELLLRGAIEIRDLHGLGPDHLLGQIANWLRNMEREPVRVLSLVHLLRKGVNAGLLRYVTAWSDQDCRQALDQLKTYVFVKTHPASGMATPDETHEDADLVFLHDKMVEWLDRGLLPRGFIEPQEVCADAIRYYEDGIAEDASRAELLRAAQLYYELRADRVGGIDRYQERSDEALSGRQIELEMNLRNELLRFFDSHAMQFEDGVYTPIGRHIVWDSAVRWVQRFLRQGRPDVARQIAECVGSSGQDPFDVAEPPLYLAGLWIYDAEALAYLSELDEAFQALDEAARALASCPDLSDTEARRRYYLLGLVCKIRGYVFARRRDYDDAITQYKRAIAIFEHPDLAEMGAAQVERAHTMRNLAWVYGENGEPVEAEDNWEPALQTFQERGYRWAEALTLNVAGGVAARFHNNDESIGLCLDALRIFTTIHDRRGIGLSSLWLARAYRRSVAYTEHPASQSRERFESAERLLSMAEGIFRDEVKEQIRLVETYAEQGKLCRDWAMAEQQNHHAKRASDLYEQGAALLKQAVDQAAQEDLVAERADYMQDQAALYLASGDLTRAIEKLDEAEAALPASSLLRPGTTLLGLRELCPVRGHLEIRGKIHLARGDVASEGGDLESAVAEWTLAEGYFRAFSDSAGLFVSQLASQEGKNLSRQPRDRLRALIAVCKRVEKEYGLPATYLHRELQNGLDVAELLGG
ncbi:MAG: AAA family ATPase [Anaerolineae bacterium]